MLNDGVFGRAVERARVSAPLLRPRRDCPSRAGHPHTEPDAAPTPTEVPSGPTPALTCATAGPHSVSPRSRPSCPQWAARPAPGSVLMAAWLCGWDSASASLPRGSENLPVIVTNSQGRVPAASRLYRLPQGRRPSCSGGLDGLLGRPPLTMFLLALFLPHSQELSSTERFNRSFQFTAFLHPLMKVFLGLKGL